MIVELIALMGAALSVILPVVSTFLIFLGVHIVSPYARKVFNPMIGWASRDLTVRLVSWSLTPWAFLIAGISAAGSALVVEGMISVFLALSGLSVELSASILAVSAGPIEESTKWLTALAFFIVLSMTLFRDRRRNPVKDGILTGFFVGASFGFLESIGYLTIGFAEVLSGGISYMTLDPVVWRIFLGVAIHGLYTAIASIGLGRPRSGAFLWSVVGLIVAVSLHSLNNGIQVFIVVIMGKEGLGDLILIDFLQIVLFAIGVIFLFSVWRGSRRRENRPHPNRFSF